MLLAAWTSVCLFKCAVRMKLPSAGLCSTSSCLGPLKWPRARKAPPDLEGREAPQSRRSIINGLRHLVRGRGLKPTGSCPRWPRLSPRFPCVAGIGLVARRAAIWRVDTWGREGRGTCAGGCGRFWLDAATCTSPSLTIRSRVVRCRRARAAVSQLVRRPAAGSRWRGNNERVPGSRLVDMSDWAVLARSGRLVKAITEAYGIRTRVGGVKIHSDDHYTNASE